MNLSHSIQSRRTEGWFHFEKWPVFLPLQAADSTMTSVVIWHIMSWVFLLWIPGRYMLSHWYVGLCSGQQQIYSWTHYFELLKYLSFGSTTLITSISRKSWSGSSCCLLYATIMSSIRSLLDSSLSSTETVLSFVETLSITNSPSIPPQNLEAPENWHDRRVLAAVSHKDDWALTEEGAYVLSNFIGLLWLICFYVDFSSTNSLLRKIHPFLASMSREYTLSMEISRSSWARCVEAPLTLVPQIQR